MAVNGISGNIFLLFYLYAWHYLMLFRYKIPVNIVRAVENCVINAIPESCTSTVYFTLLIESGGRSDTAEQNI